MKKPRIKNPILRWLAGLGILSLVVGACAGVFYGVGRYAVHILAFGTYDFGSTVGAGIIFLLMVAMCAVVAMAIIGLAWKLGDRLFKHKE